MRTHLFLEKHDLIDDREDIEKIDINSFRIPLSEIYRAEYVVYQPFPPNSRGIQKVLKDKR